MSGADRYLYPGSTVLINRLGIKQAARVDAMERALVTQRIADRA